MAFTSGVEVIGWRHGGGLSAPVESAPAGLLDAWLGGALPVPGETIPTIAHDRLGDIESFALEAQDDEDDGDDEEDDEDEEDEDDEEDGDEDEDDDEDEDEEGDEDEDEDDEDGEEEEED